MEMAASETLTRHFLHLIRVRVREYRVRELRVRELRVRELRVRELRVTVRVRVRVIISC